MPFYYPLTLGVRRPTPVDTKPGERPLRQSYETWREGVERYTSVYEECPEAPVLTQLQQRAPVQRNRLWLILGEPGAGKTTLLETWFTRWATQLPAARLGMVVPMLVRLRYVQIAQGPHDSDQWADQLWALGLQERALLEGQDHIYQQGRGRWFQPVWLLDGLDEVTPPPSERFYQALVNLPGVTVVSCRTAVYETLRREGDRYKDREYELLGIKPADQKAFLCHALGGDTRGAAALHQRIQRNPQLHWLASNPLMLSLIAQVSDRLALPATRSEFYQAAVSEMWNRRLAHHLQARFRTSQRDQVLTDLAQRMGMARIEAPLAWLEEAARHVAGAGYESFIATLVQAGVVRLHRWDTVDFVHLTFQEFYLACGLRARGLRQALADYWDDARYEETLGLLIAMMFQERQYGDIDHGLRWLVEWGEELHCRTPHILWRKRRSPLRVALHLLHRAGAPLKFLSETEGWLWEKINRSTWGKDAIALDSKMPLDMLSTLAQDTEGTWRWNVAGNPSTPPEALARLARDANWGVRKTVARNRSTPPELLIQLAQDVHRQVRWAVAWNPSTPPEALTRLAKDTYYMAYLGAARHPSTPPEALAQMAQDADWEVRSAAARSPNLPPELLARLALDVEPRVRESARSWAASNPNTPADLLTQLAQDVEVRSSVAHNPNTPPELLVQLAQDADWEVRERVAWNPNASADLLIRLAQDTHPRVLERVAHNPNTPPEVLVQLAQNAGPYVRSWAASNPIYPGISPEHHVELVQDAGPYVRSWAAGNPSTPADFLARLAQDADPRARFSAIRNPSMPADLLARLAQEGDPDLRRDIADHPNTLLEDL